MFFLVWINESLKFWEKIQLDYRCVSTIPPLENMIQEKISPPSPFHPLGIPPEKYDSRNDKPTKPISPPKNSPTGKYDSRNDKNLPYPLKMYTTKMISWKELK